MGQHVVVHVDGSAVVDRVAQTLGEDGLACIGGQAEQEEAGLSSRESVDGLMLKRKRNKHVLRLILLL